MVGYDGNKKVFGSKIHVAVNEDSLPLSIVVGSANEHDSRKFIPVMQKISIRTGARPRSRPEEVYADKAYDSFFVRAYLACHKIKARIARLSRKKKPGRPPVFSKRRYRRNRSCVERFFGWLKLGFRRLAIRYERLSETFMGFLHLAAFIMHWRVLR
jgi:transposase